MGAFKKVILFLFLMTIITDNYAFEHGKRIFLSNENLSQKNDYKIRVIIKNQPKESISLARIKGSKILLLDSINYLADQLNEKSIKKTFKYLITLPQELPTGMYRLSFGKTIAAELLNEPPQILDIIFNKEDIVLSTNFYAPFDSLKIIKSQENKIWYNFTLENRKLQEKLKYAKLELNYCYQDNQNPKADCDRQIQAYNELQNFKKNLIDKSIVRTPDYFANKIIKMHKEPFLDGKLNIHKRELALKNTWLNELDFSDESLINTSVYTDIVYKYLMLYAQKGLTKGQQEAEFIKAIDKLLQELKSEDVLKGNGKVYDFILDYLVSGFEATNMPGIVDYIGENYTTTVCESDKRNVLERKLAFKKMTVGTSVPDFKMPDLNNDVIRLDEVLKPINLVVFWLSDCPHCIKMLPKIKEWQKQNHNHIEILAISLDDLHSKWEKKVFELGIESWYNFSDLKAWDGQTALDYNIYSAPSMFVVDKNKKILSKPKTINELFEFFMKR